MSERGEVLDRRAFPPVGRCIYCGAADGLSREHIVAYGLGGSAVLPQASCGACAEATGDVERRVLRANLRPVRLLRQLPSRRGHRDAPRRYPLRVVRGDREEEVLLPVHEYPILASFPRFPPPGFLRGETAIVGINVQGADTISFGPTPEEVCRRLGARSITLSNSHESEALARMVAKIAYCFAAATRELEMLAAPSPVVPAILGDTNDIGAWVGTLTGPRMHRPGQLHWLAVHRDEPRGLLFGEVQLFCDSHTPSYGVVLGPLADDRSRTSRWLPAASAQPKRERPRRPVREGRVIEIKMERSGP